MILILTQCFPSRVGGIESLISNLALQLRKKNKVIVFADRHHLFYDSIYDNLHKNEILIRRTGGIKFFRRRKKIKEIKPFIDSNNVKFIVADTWKSLELGIEYFNKNNIPTFCLAHGNELISENTKKMNRIKNTLNKSTFVIANSKFTKNLLKKILPNKNNINYVYPGANDLRDIKSDNFTEVNGNPIIITLARLEKRKGHLQILKVIKKLKTEFPKILYFIAGDGEEKSNLKKFVNDNQLISNVRFVGLVNENQKKFLFEKANLMIMPTLDETDKRSIEGFGIAYLEAAFFGIPSIASSVGGTPEVVINESTGMIIRNCEELYETTRNLLKNNSNLKLLGENAQKRSINNFKWDKVVNDYYSIFTKIAQ